MKGKTDSGVLYIVATPIGNLADITQRALDTLAEVDLIAAEDTRHSRRMLNHYGIKTSLLSLHEHNEQQRAQQLLERLQQGQSIALISDAGTPVISDPGFRVIDYLHQENITVVPIPGACAAIAALSAAGMPAEQFVFVGFLSPKKSQRQHQLQDLQNETRTWLCYEAPHRIVGLLQDMQAILGDEREVVIARELTKKFETIHRAKLAELVPWIEADSNQQRGEFVVIVRGQEKSSSTELSADTIKTLTILLEELPLKQAVAIAAKLCDEKKNQLYAYAIQQKT